MNIFESYYNDSLTSMSRPDDLSIFYMILNIIMGYWYILRKFVFYDYEKSNNTSDIQFLVDQFIDCLSATITRMVQYLSGRRSDVVRD